MASNRDNSVALIAMVAGAGAIIAVTALWVYRAEPGVRTVIRRVIPEALQPAEPPPPPPTDLTPTPTARGGAPRPAAVVSTSASAPVAAAPTAIESPDVRPTSGPPIADATDTTVAKPVGPLTVYNGRDEGVMAPEAIRAQLGSQRIAQSANQRVRFEFVVDTNGNVESARVVPDASTTLGDTMLSTVALQVIRGWRFRPATKDGLPVRFRQEMTFTGDGRSTTTP